MKRKLAVKPEGIHLRSTVQSIVNLLIITVFVSNLASANVLDTKRFNYFFSKKEVFQVNFADYPKGEESKYELFYQHAAPLPKELKTLQTSSLKISGNNHSDDLFMYAYKKVSGLKPNTLYQMNVSLEFASNAPKGDFGVGGATGDSVFVKIGALTNKPKRFVDNTNMVQVNIDKGNQGTDGKDMVVIGTIGVDTSDARYKLKTLPENNEETRFKLNNYRVLSNEKGEAWLIFGTDSGFESKTTLFYTHLALVFTEC